MTSYDHTNPAEYGTDAHQKEIAVEAARLRRLELHGQVQNPESSVADVEAIDVASGWPG